MARHNTYLHGVLVVYGGQQPHMGGDLGDGKHPKIIIVELCEHLIKHLWRYVWTLLGHFLA
jgi:hypothetical protein